MLPVENLDTKSYTETVAEAVASISKFTEEWNDFGSHDPGITMLEMLSWLVDMQRYYLNRITERNRLKYFNLYGIKPEVVSMASAFASLGLNKDKAILPAGVKLKADEQVFEISERAVLVNNSIVKVITRIGNSDSDIGHMLGNRGTGFYPFGKDMAEPNKLYIGFAKGYLAGSKLDIFFDVLDDCPVRLNPSKTLKYHINIKYSCYTNEKKWTEMKVERDGALYMTKPGSVRLSVDDDMIPIDLQNEGSFAYYMCIEVIDAGSNVLPKFRDISLNCVSLLNKNKLIAHADMMNEGSPLVLDEYIYYAGDLTVQARTSAGYIDLNEEYYSVQYDDEDLTVTVTVDNQWNNVRIIGYDRYQSYKRVVGRSNGMPCQSFPYWQDGMILDELMFEVGNRVNGTVIWEDYTYVRDFALSARDVRCFTVDLSERLIVFSSSEEGIIPEAAWDFDNIRVVNLILTDKERGNVRDGEIKSFDSGLMMEQGIQVLKSSKATGGRRAMTSADYALQVAKKMRVSRRAVSLTDYEKAALHTPGLRIALARAVILPGDINKVTIVVAPFTRSDMPRADERMLDVVRRHVDRYRLITTEVIVTGPVYAAIWVTVSIRAKNAVRFDKEELKTKIMDYLTPLSSSGVKTDYKIGHPIMTADVMQLVNGFDNVGSIDYLRMDVSGDGARRDDEGNIILPYNGIIWCMDVDLSVY